MWLRLVSTVCEGLEMQDLEPNTNEAFSLLMTVVGCGAIIGEGRDGGGAYSRFKLPTRFGGGGDSFYSPVLRLDRCCFMVLLRVDTHLLQAL